MSICRIAMMAYMSGEEWEISAFDGYTPSDLRDMIQWCRDMLAEGLTHEPHDQFSLEGFIKWTTKELAAQRKKVT